MPRIGDIVDFSKRKHQASARHLFHCPTCGLIGERHVYRDGDASYVHRMRLRSCYWEVLDACYIKSP